jgi:choline dehydrogenase
VNPISSFFQAAFIKLGLPVAEDFVSGTLSGVQYAANTINPRGNVRDSSYTSFVQNVPKLGTLDIRNNTLAKRIIFEGKSAVGVAVSSNGQDYVLSATKEVILSAGAVRALSSKVDLKKLCN